LVTSIGDPQSILNKSHAAHVHAVHLAERERRLQPREGRAIVACARTVSR
jgi:cytosine/adenosine deaminase-related metal-dependent hydrolase